MNFRRYGFVQSLTLVTMTVSFVLAGCSRSDDATNATATKTATTATENPTLDSNETPPPPPSPILGSWKGTCEKTRGSTNLIGTYSRESHVFSESGVKTHVDFFEDEKCSMLEIRATYSGSYQTPEGTGAEPKKIDLDYVTVTLKPLTSAGSDVLHFLEICGIGEAWERERELDVTEVAGQEKCLDRSKGAIYTIHALKDSELFFGAFDVRRNPETRPTKLLETSYTR